MSVRKGDDVRFDGTFHAPVLGKGTQNITNITIAAAEADHLRSGMGSLRARDYPSAEQHFRRLLALRPNDPTAHYYLAIAILGGRNPSDHSTDTIDLVIRHLRTAALLDASRHPAKIAALLVQDAYVYRWGRSRKFLNQRETSLVRRVPADRARELTDHIPAPESVWWKALSSRSAKSKRRKSR